MFRGRCADVAHFLCCFIMTKRPSWSGVFGNVWRGTPVDGDAARAATPSDHRGVGDVGGSRELQKSADEIFRIIEEAILSIGRSSWEFGSGEELESGSGSITCKSPDRSRTLSAGRSITAAESDSNRSIGSRGGESCPGGSFGGRGRRGSSSSGTSSEERSTAKPESEQNSDRSGSEGGSSGSDDSSEIMGHDGALGKSAGWWQWKQEAEAMSDNEDDSPGKKRFGAWWQKRMRQKRRRRGKKKNPRR